MSTEETRNDKRPTHEISIVSGEDGEKQRWTRVGVAFTNKDGKGFNLFLDAVPLGTGRLVARQIEYKSNGGDNGGQQ